jgi:hypothetical protein
MRILRGCFGGAIVKVAGGCIGRFMWLKSIIERKEGINVFLNENIKKDADFKKLSSPKNRQQSEMKI